MNEKKKKKSKTNEKDEPEDNSLTVVMGCKIRG